MKTIYKIKIKKGDTVTIRTGKYKGQSGKVVSTHPTLNAVTVEGINIVKKHVKPNRQQPQGAIVELTKPINVSKVMIAKEVKKSTKKGAK